MCSSDLYHFKDFKNHSDILNGDEAKINLKLMGDNALTLNDANWVLNGGKVQRKKDNDFKQRNLGKRSIIFSEFAFFLTWYKRIYRRIQNIFDK